MNVSTHFFSTLSGPGIAVTSTFATSGLTAVTLLGSSITGSYLPILSSITTSTLLGNTFTTSDAKGSTLSISTIAASSINVSSIQGSSVTASLFNGLSTVTTSTLLTNELLGSTIIGTNLTTNTVALSLGTYSTINTNNISTNVVNLPLTIVGYSYSALSINLNTLNGSTITTSTLSGSTLIYSTIQTSSISVSTMSISTTTVSSVTGVSSDASTAVSLTYATKPTPPQNITLSSVFISNSWRNRLTWTAPVSSGGMPYQTVILSLWDSVTYTYASNVLSADIYTTSRDGFTLYTLNSAQIYSDGIYRPRT